MATYTKSIQAVLTDEQHEALLELSHKLNKPVSVLIRDAIDEVYFEQTRREKRRQALQTLLSLDAPVADWEEMEEEIIRGAVE